MVKGTSRRAILVRSPDRRIFDEAIFIVREDLFRETGVTGEMAVKEAQAVADRYIKEHVRRSPLRRLAAPLAFLCGAAATGLAWLLTVIF